MAYTMYDVRSGYSRGYSVTTGVYVHAEESWNNRSLITIWFDLHAGSQAYFAGHQLTGGFAWYINGGYAGGWGPSGQYAMPGFNSYIRLYGWYGWVGHDANGNLSISSNGNIRMVNQGFSYSLPYLQVGGSGSGTNFDRRPAAPSSVSVTLNPDKTIYVESNAVSSPASTAQYYISWSTSSNDASWSAWSSEVSLGTQRGRLFGSSDFNRGQFIRFRMRAGNSDGLSAYTLSSSIFYPAGGRILRSGSFVPTNIARRHEGGTWKDIQIARIFRNGQWVNLS